MPVSFFVFVIAALPLKLFDVLQLQLLWQLSPLDDVDVLLECPIQRVILVKNTIVTCVIHINIIYNPTRFIEKNIEIFY